MTYTTLTAIGEPRCRYIVLGATQAWLRYQESVQAGEVAFACMYLFQARDRARVAARLREKLRTEKLRQA